MLWVLLDVALGLASLVVLGLVALRLYRQVRVLARQAGAASAQLGELAADLTVTPPRR